MFDTAHTGSMVIAGLLVLLFILEAVLPLRKRTRPRAGRMAVNLALTVGAYVVGTYIVRAAALGVSVWAGKAPFGLLNIVELPGSIRAVLGFLLMDLTFYYWHRANHEVGLLWRFHLVHHVDPDVDVTTSFRFHMGEVLLSAGFRVLQVGLLGVSPVVYAAYELAFTCETAFHHSNLRLMFHVEQFLNKVIVTPRMHGIHHSVVKGENQSNYSTIFRWWDVLHGSLRLGVRQAEVQIGVPAYLGPEDNGIVSLLAIPFQGQRDYWRFPDGSVPQREVAADNHTLTE